MALKWLILVSFLLSCGNNSLVPVCSGLPCYDGPPNTEGIGECKGGTLQCFPDGGQICVGEQLPQLEIQCSDKDLACTGTLNSEVPLQTCYDGPPNTDGVGICHSGIIVCNGAQSVCSGEVIPQPEQCSPIGMDFNCNGIPNDIPTSYCYTGPPNSAGKGTCVPGELECQNGQEVCANEVTPTGTDFCGEPDTQCLGHEPTTTDPVDVVFMLDNTDISCEDGMGSASFIQLQQTMVRFMAEYTQSNFKYGLIVMPGCGGNWGSRTDAGYTLYQNMAVESTAIGPASVQCVVDDSSDDLCLSEPYYIYDLVYEQILGQIIPWDNGAQKYIVIATGDEGEASGNIIVNGLAVGPVQIAQSLQNNKVTLVSFIGNAMGDYYNFSNYIFTVTYSDEMLYQLNQSLQFPCSDGG